MVAFMLCIFCHNKKKQVNSSKTHKITAGKLFQSLYHIRLFLVNLVLRSFHVGKNLACLKS